MPDVADKDGWRALHFAALVASEGCVRALLEAGAEKAVFTENADQQYPKAPVDLVDANKPFAPECRRLLVLDPATQSLTNAARDKASRAAEAARRSKADAAREMSRGGAGSFKLRPVRAARGSAARGNQQDGNGGGDFAKTLRRLAYAACAAIVLRASLAPSSANA